MPHVRDESVLRGYLNALIGLFSFCRQFLVKKEYAGRPATTKIIQCLRCTNRTAESETHIVVRVTIGHSGPSIRLARGYGLSGRVRRRLLSRRL